MEIFLKSFKVEREFCLSNFKAERFSQITAVTREITQLYSYNKVILAKV